MGFFANFKAKRAAKRAQSVYESALLDWERENKVLAQALEIFIAAQSGQQPDDHSLTQKKGELVLWTGQGVLQVAGRTPSTYSGGSQGFSIPLVAGIRYRVGSFKGTMTPGVEMQMDKDQGMVKLTNQRLIFAGPIATTEWAFAKILSTFSNPDRTDFIIGVSNRQKSSGVRFSSEDGYVFSHLFAMGLYSYENGIPATIKAIQDELKEGTTDKPMLQLPPNL
ncbi:unannotated protein [freshwater metagenome]|uniref:Unannotated protein n=1 Tax=freshwater metagenome TaxID=449393 RepID=A0A6J6KGH9_9ZZZZ|nr:hypothetical protein [Actinomycetota bacterium]